MRDYNDRLFNGLVIASLVLILLFRFVIQISLLETLGWLAFAFLQVGPPPFQQHMTFWSFTPSCSSLKNDDSAVLRYVERFPWLLSSCAERDQIERSAFEF